MRRGEGRSELWGGEGNRWEGWEGEVRGREGRREVRGRKGKRGEESRGVGKKRKGR